MPHSSGEVGLSSEGFVLGDGGVQFLDEVGSVGSSVEFVLGEQTLGQVECLHVDELALVSRSNDITTLNFDLVSSCSI